MARFLALSPRQILLAAAVGSLISGFPAPSAAQTPMAPANSSPANAKPAPTAMANKPGTPTPAQDPFNRYGNILQPGVEPDHPLRLSLPFPDVGEIKVPTPDQLAMREKLETLAALSDDQIRDELSKWPPFTKMSLRDEAQMLSRIQDFRDRRSKVAQQAAHDMGLLTLTPDQEARFEKEYWNKRLPMERDLAKQFETILKQRQTQLSESLYREFSSPNGPLTQPPKPPGPANKPATPVANKPPAPTQTAQAGTISSTPPVH